MVSGSSRKHLDRNGGGGVARRRSAVAHRWTSRSPLPTTSPAEGDVELRLEWQVVFAFRISTDICVDPHMLRPTSCQTKCPAPTAV